MRNDPLRMRTIRELTRDFARLFDGPVILTIDQIPGRNGCVDDRRKRIELHGLAEFIEAFLHSSATIQVTAIPMMTGGIVRVRSNGLAEVFLGGRKIAIS